jgi:hypothetical protein
LVLRLKFLKLNDQEAAGSQEEKNKFYDEIVKDTLNLKFGNITNNFAKDMLRLNDNANSSSSPSESTLDADIFENNIYEELLDKHTKERTVAG